MLILLVDDDPEDRLIFEESVHAVSPDYKCIGVRDGEEALQYLQHEAVVLPDLIFLDINMPKLDGRQTLSLLKSSNTFRNIPVCVYTTESRPVERDAIIELGARWFVTKPASILEVRNCIATVIKEVSSR